MYVPPTTDDLARLPSELTQYPQFVLWRYLPKPDDPTTLTKVPIQSDGQRYADTSNPQTWDTFERICEALPVVLEDWKDTPYPEGGIGFVFTKTDPFCGIDFDHCRTHGETAPSVKAWVERLGSYTEISPSDTGLHVICKATFPAHGRRKDGIEMYDTGRFFTMTGWRIDAMPDTINPAQETVDALWSSLVRVQEVQHHDNVTPSAMTDEAIIDNGKRSTDDGKFSDLYKGNWRPWYPTSDKHDSQSEPDRGFCQRLAFYTSDPAQIDRIFRRSGLMRPKWDEVHYANGSTYGQETIRKAIASQTVHYTPMALVPTGDAFSVNGTTKGNVDDWKAKLDRVKTTRLPAQTINNMVRAIRHLEPWQSQGCWYDTVRERHMVGAVPLQDGDATHAGVMIGQETGMRVTNIALAGKALDYVCRETTRDLLQEWVDALPEAPVSTLLTTWLATYARVPSSVPPEYVSDLSRIIPVAMIARIVEPGCQFREVVILEGDENAGKSALTKALAGHDAYGRPWHVALSAGMEGKEAHMMLEGALIAELEELSSYSKTDESRMKALVTAQVDSFVPKYSNKRADHPRRTIFIATVNPEGDGRYLKGQTGNTRWLPIKVGTVDLAGFLAVRMQLFAEAKAYYHAHLHHWWHLDHLSHANGEREGRRQMSVYETPGLEYWLKGRSQCRWDEVAEDCLHIPKERWNRAMQLEIGKALRACGWHPGRTTNARYWEPG